MHVDWSFSDSVSDINDAVNIKLNHKHKEVVVNNAYIEIISLM